MRRHVTSSLYPTGRSAVRLSNVTGDCYVTLRCVRNTSSSYWRSQFAGVRKEDHIAKVTSLLQGSSLDVSIIHQLCASQCALLMLLDKWEIRQEGDRLVHKDLLNVQHYTVAIEQQSQSDLRSPRHSSFYKVKQLLQDWASEVLYVNLAMRLTN